MALNADETCVCNTNYYQSDDANGDPQCTLCPDESTRDIESLEQSIAGCGMYSRITILSVKKCIFYLSLILQIFRLKIRKYHILKVKNTQLVLDCVDPKYS